jgi:prepilin-type N-terminal cleavage/methylation domain-containing protein
MPIAVMKNKDGFTPTPICIVPANMKSNTIASSDAISLRCRCANRCEGFTLPEVVVAAALLLVAMVPILKALTQANLDSVIIERRTQSLCLAQGKLNQIKARSIYDFNSISDSNTALGNSYLCRVTQTTVSSNLKAITVSVGQDIDRDGSLTADEVEITLQTQIAKRWP